MPIAFDPDARRTYTLKVDRDKPFERRPTFAFRYQTRRAKQRYLELSRMAETELRAMDADGVVQRLYAALGDCLVGWEGLTGPGGEPIAYQPDNLTALDEVLTDSELWELYWAGASDIDQADSAFFAQPPSSPAAPVESAAAVAEKVDAQDGSAGPVV